MDPLRQDLRSSLRYFRRHRGFVAAAVLVLALGIGATTAVFSVSEALLLRPLPYRDRDRLVALRSVRRLDAFPVHPRRGRDAGGLAAAGDVVRCRRRLPVDFAGRDRRHTESSLERTAGHAGVLPRVRRSGQRARLRHERSRSRRPRTGPRSVAAPLRGRRSPRRRDARPARPRSLPRGADPVHGARGGDGPGALSPDRSRFRARGGHRPRYGRFLAADVHCADRHPRSRAADDQRRRKAPAGRYGRVGASRDGRHCPAAGGGPSGGPSRLGGSRGAVARSDRGGDARRRRAACRRHGAAATHRLRQRGHAPPRPQRRSTPRGGGPRRPRRESLADSATVPDRSGRARPRRRRPRRGPRLVGHRPGPTVAAAEPAGAAGDGDQSDRARVRRPQCRPDGVHHRRGAGAPGGRDGGRPAGRSRCTRTHVRRCEQPPRRGPGRRRSGLDRGAAAGGGAARSERAARRADGDGVQSLQRVDDDRVAAGEQVRLGAQRGLRPAR